VRCLRPSPLILILTLIPRTVIQMMTRARMLVRLVLVVPKVENDLVLHRLVSV